MPDAHPIAPSQGAAPSVCHAPEGPRPPQEPDPKAGRCWQQKPFQINRLNQTLGAHSNMDDERGLRLTGVAPDVETAAEALVSVALTSQVFACWLQSDDPDQHL